MIMVFHGHLTIIFNWVVYAGIRGDLLSTFSNDFCSADSIYISHTSSIGGGFGRGGGVGATIRGYTSKFNFHDLLS